MQSSFAEVEAFSNEHNWIADIHLFVKTWDQEILDSWKGQPASKIEVRIVNTIEKWAASSTAAWSSASPFCA